MKKTLGISLIILILLLGTLLILVPEKQEEEKEESKLTEEEIEAISEPEIKNYCNKLWEERNQSKNLADNLPACGTPMYNITETIENFEITVYQGLSYKGGHKGVRTLSLIIDKQGNILEKNF